MIKLLKLSVRLSFIAVLLANASARAAPTPDDPDPNLPQREQVCVNNVVSKRQLAAVLLVNTKNYDAVVGVSRGPNLWRTIYTDDNFCHVPVNCGTKPDTDACKAAAKCGLYKSEAVQAAISFFISLNHETKRPNPLYTENDSLAALSNGNIGDQVSRYFEDAADAYKIGCTATVVQAPAQPFDPTKDPVLSKIRVRGLSDDLNFDRSQIGFKSTTPATVSYSGATSPTQNATKVNGAFGYAFDTIPQTEIVPYVSTYQSITAVSGKATVFDPNNNVAGGILAQHYFDYDGVSHVFSVKPQFLYDTTSRADLASLRAIYAPWMDIPVNINTFRRLDFLPGSPWGEFMFNLRDDVGGYPYRGTPSSVAAMNQNFERAGTQVGFTLSTDGVANMPSLTWIILETYVYGFAGFYRNINQFQTSLTYNFPNSYFGLTASYTNGRNEDTAIFAQTWTIGLSAHY